MRTALIFALFLLVIFSTSAFAVEDPDKYRLYQFTYIEKDDCSCSVEPDICGGRYLAALNRRIVDAWNPPSEAKQTKQIVVFTIHKNGRLSDLKLISHNENPYSQSALLAIRDSAPFFPLPKGAPESVVIQYTFSSELQKHKSERRISEFDFVEKKLGPYLTILLDTVREKWYQSEGNKSKVIIGFTMNPEGKLYNYVVLTQAKDRSTQVMFDIIKELNPIDLPPGLPGEIRIKFTFDPTIREPYISEAQLIQP